MLLNCASKQHATDMTKLIETPPRIVFLKYAIKKTPKGQKKIRFIDKKMAGGRLKNHHKNSKENFKQGDLICYQLDKKSSILDSSIIKNPLLKSIEYLDDSKSFQTDTVDLDSARFSLRLQLNTDTRYISIHMFNVSKNKTKPLIKTKLN